MHARRSDVRSNRAALGVRALAAVLVAVVVGALSASSAAGEDTPPPLEEEEYIGDFAFLCERVATTYNGWSAIAASETTSITAGSKSTSIRQGDVATVLSYFATQFDARVEAISAFNGYRSFESNLAAGGSCRSDHMSGTALDINGGAHPWEARPGVVYPANGGFTTSQLAAIRAIQAEVSGVVQWGGDYGVGNRDAMHFYIHGTASAVQNAVRNLWGSPPPTGGGGTTPPPAPRAWIYLSNASVLGAATFAGFQFGDAGDQLVRGDWDGNGTETIGVFRGGTWYLNNQNDNSAPELAFGFGAAGDIALAGDWDGDGVDTTGVYRAGLWYLRGSNDLNSAFVTIGWGNPSGDVPVVGDWDGNGTDTPGLFRGGDRGGEWFINNGLTAHTDHTFIYGNNGDAPAAGDWDGNGTDTPAVIRGNIWYLNNGLDGTAELAPSYGNPGDTPFPGNWDGVGGDGFGVLRY